MAALGELLVLLKDSDIAIPTAEASIHYNSIHKA
jgi:hypothetical protein